MYANIHFIVYNIIITVTKIIDKVESLHPTKKSFIKEKVLGSLIAAHMGEK